ncbi:MAG: HAD family hydrolase, partial [Planctomycetota bacterium]
KLFLYPVRGIRRKNLGEAVLWATLAGRGHAVAITLPPQNPVELRAYRRWQRFATRHELPCLFDVGAPGGLDFAQNLVAADAMLTTSVAEGFGMVFLETWLRGKPLVGRNLPEITADFVAEGLQLDGLYDALWIPLDAVDATLVQNELRVCFDQVLADYGRGPMGEHDFEAAWRELTPDGAIDFAYLSVAAQRQLIARIVGDTKLKEAVCGLNPKVVAALETTSSAAVDQNAACVEQGYSAEATGAALQRALGAVKQSAHEPARGLPGYARVLNTFLIPQKCHPLRMEPVAPPASRLIEIIRSGSTPMSPIPTGEVPQLQPLSDIDAILFDIYGTLLVSGSGDIGIASAEGGDPRSAAFCAAWAMADLGDHRDEVEGPAVLVETIRRHHAAARQLGVDFPEVDIIEVWEEVVAQCCHLPRQVSHTQLAVLATEYEVRVNPVWPMPQMVETLQALRHRGLPLGIVSNAQFFTPFAFPALCGESLDQLGFDPTLSGFSYQQLVAKPSVAMFAEVARVLQNRGIAPQNTLYVGNDMRNDVMPAATLGMKTALFAGDQRSLRRRAGDALVAGIVPDVVLTDLNQLFECVGSSSSAPRGPADEADE